VTAKGDASPGEFRTVKVTRSTPYCLKGVII